jgi:hypothetical protein
MATLAQAITALETTLATITALKRVYADPPESINEFPAATVYVRRGEMTVVSAGLAKNLHTLVVDIYHARQELPQAVNESKQWPGAVLAKLASDFSLNGTVDAIVWPVRYEARPLQYGNLVHYGVRFEITVKMMEILA